MPRRIGKATYEGNARTNLAGILLARSELSAAAEELRRALRVHRTSGQRLSEWRSANQLTLIHLRRYEVEEARTQADGALALADDVGDLGARAFARSTAGRVALAEDDVNRAAQGFECARELATSGSHPIHLADALSGLAEVEERAGDIREAIALHRLAVVSARQSARKYVDRCVLVGLARALGRDSQWNEALDLLDDVRTGISARDDRRLGALTLGLRAEALHERGEVKRAQEILVQAFDSMPSEETLAERFLRTVSSRLRR
ncbi:MAG: hypothetical protein AAF211_31810 [Myxococcota bacterium]